MLWIQVYGSQAGTVPLIDEWYTTEGCFQLVQ